MYHKKLITYLHFAILLHHEINNVNALKLTPVQQLTQRIDLSSESQSSYLVVSNALKKKQQFMQFLIDDENYTMPSDSTLFSNFKDLLNTAEFQKMQLTIQRWNLIETKLRHAISLGNPGQIQAFEDIVHNIASSKVLFGHALLLTGPEGDTEALNYLDSSCPVILNYAASWRSIDTDGWLDCFVSLQYLYSKYSMLTDLKHLESKLEEKLPWLLSVISSGTQTSDSLLSQLSSLNRKDRKVLSMELKNSWTLIESIRESFKILVEDFMNSNSARIRLGTFIKAQQVTDEILEHFAKSTAVTEKDAAAYTADSSSINITALRNKLHNEIRRETWTYLFVMNGVVDSGESFVKDLRLLLDSGTGDWNSILSGGSSLSSDYGSYDFDRKTIGFIDLDAILHIFEVALDAVQVRDAALLSSHTAALKDEVVEDFPAKQSSQHSSASKNKQQKQPRSSTTSKKKPSTRSRHSTSPKQTFREAPETSHPSQKQRSELGNLWDLIVSYTSFALLVFIVIAAVGGHILKNMKQPLRGNRSGYRYQNQLNSAKGVIQNITKTVGLMSYMVCWFRSQFFSTSKQLNGPFAQTFVSLSNIQTEVANENDNYLPVSIISILIEDTLIFVHEIRRGLARLFKVIPLSTNAFKTIAKPVAEKVNHYKNLVIDCDVKSASTYSPPSPIAIATISPGSSSSRQQQEHFPIEEQQSSSSHSKAKLPSKKRNNKSGTAESSTLVASSNAEFATEPFCSNPDNGGSADFKTETCDKKSNSSQGQNKSPKDKSKKASTSTKKKVAQLISASAASAVEEQPLEKPETVTNDDLVMQNDSVEINAPESDAQEIVFEVDQQQEAEALSLKDETIPIVQSDMLISVMNDEWDDTDGEWISASGSQGKCYKVAISGSDAVKEKQSAKEAALCRQQLMRKREEEAYCNHSPRSKPIPKSKDRDKDKNPPIVKAVAAVAAKVAVAAVKNSTVLQSDDRGKISTPEGDKLGYSAVLIKNIPPSMIVDPVVPVEHPSSSSSSSGPVSASINNSKRAGGQKFRSGNASPVGHKNQGRASPRSKPNSITSSSTTATTVADEEPGNLSDSETSSATMNQISDESLSQYPVNLVPAGFQLIGQFPFTAPNLLTSEELVQYNLNMMMGFYPHHFGGQVHVPMAMPMAWPCIPDMGIPFHPTSPPQYFAPLKPENQTDETSTPTASPGIMFQHPHPMPHGLVSMNPFYGITDPASMPPMYGLDLFPSDGSPAVDILPAAQMMYLNRSRENSPSAILPAHPLPLPLSPEEMLLAIRIQIEYYFSAVNLKTDSYLRGLMDSEGFVSLEPIVFFNRIKSFRATCQQILEAIKGSKLLEIKASAEAQDALDGKAAIAALPDSIILSTRIRGVENPLA